MLDEATSQKLHNAAEKLGQCTYSPQSTFRYDIMSDAIVWEDEIPSPPLGDAMIVRLLLRFRTSALLSTPDINLEPYWRLGGRLFPSWPGFRPDRNTPSEQLREYYVNHTKNA
jgi:hypothetical protein